MNIEDRPLNKDELDLLPFDFKDAYYAKPDSTNTQYYFAKWHGRLAYSTDLNQGWFYEDDDSDVTLEQWENHYPGFQHLNDRRVAPYLRGTYKGKSVRWSRSQNHWEYLNHRAVDFTAEDEQQVSDLLESATLSTSRVLSSLTPEQRTPSLPGELPESPKPLPISAATLLRTRLLPLKAQDNEELVRLQVDADTGNLHLLDMLLDLELFLCLAID